MARVTDRTLLDYSAYSEGFRLDYDSANEDSDDYVLNCVLRDTVMKRVLAWKEKARERLGAVRAANRNLKAFLALGGGARALDGLVALAACLTSMLVARTLAERRRP